MHTQRGQEEIVLNTGWAGEIWLVRLAAILQGRKR